MVNCLRLIHIKLNLIITIVWSIIDSRANEKSLLTIMDNYNSSNIITKAISTTETMTSYPITWRTNPDHISSSTSVVIKGPNNNDQIPCTCGIFLGSELKKQSQNVTNNSALIINELNHGYTCDARGQNRCRTSCLNQIMQYLPNSDHIICASSSGNVLKEKAYLLIKNCDNYWVNTNLTSGHEYCCKDNKPYKCTNK